KLFQEHGNRKKAMQHLKSPVHHRTLHRNTFFSGICMGLAIPAIVSGIYRSMTSSSRPPLPIHLETSRFPIRNPSENTRMGPPARDICHPLYSNIFFLAYRPQCSCMDYGSCQLSFHIWCVASSVSAI